MGWTQYSVAYHLGLRHGWETDQGTISAIERGVRQVTDYELRALALVLKAEVSEFFSRAPEELHDIFKGNGKAPVYFKPPESSGNPKPNKRA
jgi:transcriptional regulator with XRE-family HTH domain